MAWRIAGAEMSERFRECLEFVLAREGGYVSNPADPGGATNKGITQAVYDDYRVRKGVNRQPVVGISGDEVEDIYASRYWNIADCEVLPPPVDLVVFDAAVNSGPRQAVRWLQRITGVSQDGAIGPQTLAAVTQYADKHGAKALAKDFIAVREEFIDTLVDKNPQLSVFQKGWNNRMALLRAAVNEVA